MSRERAELSKKNPYHIPRYRYYELKYFCRQYNDWKKALTLIDGWQTSPNDISGISDGVKEDAPLIDDAVDDVTQNAMDIAKGTLGTISKVMGDDYDYTPQIVPVVDLTNVLEGADEIDNAFASTRSLSLDGDISRNLANQIDAEVQLQNGVKNKGNDDTLNAINGLAGHMDGIVDSIRGMKMTIDGRKTIGYIDNWMGQIAAAKVR